MSFTSAPLPDKDALVNPQTGIALQVLLEWAAALSRDIDTAPGRLDTVTLTTQGASIGATSLQPVSLSAGLYRVTYYARITRAATVSSSLIVGINFTSGAVACSVSDTAITGNTTGTVGTRSWLVKVDGRTPITYFSTYASVGGTSMQYELSLVLEQIDA